MALIKDCNAFNSIRAIEINGIKTDLICHKFKNKMYLCITQFEKVNNIFTVWNSNKIANGFAHGNNGSFVEHKFGATGNEIESAIHYIISQVPQLSTNLDVIITLGLVSINRQVLSTIVRALTKILT